MPAARLFHFLVLSSVLLIGARGVAFAQPGASTRPGTAGGQVVDATGAAIVRARVRLVDAAGRSIDATLTDDRGRFSLAQSPCATCRLEIALPGFVTASVAAAGVSGDTRVVLAVAPIRESVVVSATRDVAPASQVATSTTVFTREAIARRGAPTVGELLRSAPGVTVVRAGGLGGVTSLFVRGGDSSYNKVLLDGIPLNEPGGTFNFGNLTTANVERVELARGAQSALFGSDAMSSVVQLFTRRGIAGRPRVGLDWEGGGYATQRFGADASGGTDRVDYSVGVSRLETDNRTENGRFENTTVSWQAGTDASQPIAVRFVGRLEDQRVGTPGATAFGRANLDARFDRQDATAGVTVAHRASRFKQRVTYAYARSSQASVNLEEDPPYVPAFESRRATFTFTDFLYDLHNVLERHHVSYQADWRLPRTSGAAEQYLTAVVDVDAERAALDDRLAGSIVPASRNNVGVSAQYQVVASRASVVGGVRVEENASFGTAVVPRLSATIGLRDGGDAWGRLDVKLNAGLGVKEPTILQSFSPSPFARGNAHLEPERSRTFDAGVEQRLANDRVKVALVWFANRYRNQVSTRTTNPETFEAQYFNVGLTRARGIEAVVEAAPAPDWRIGGSYTLLASRILESTSLFNPVFAPGSAAFRRPRHSGAVHLGWARGAADVALYGRFVGRRTDSDFAALEPPMLEAEAYATWSLTARYRLRAPLDLTFRVDNLSGAEYMEPLGFPTWGRSAHAGVRVRF